MTRIIEDACASCGGQAVREYASDGTHLGVTNECFCTPPSTLAGGGDPVATLQGRLDAVRAHRDELQEQLLDARTEIALLTRQHDADAASLAVVTAENARLRDEVACVDRCDQECVDTIDGLRETIAALRTSLSGAGRGNERLSCENEELLRSRGAIEAELDHLRREREDVVERWNTHYCALPEPDATNPEQARFVRDWLGTVDDIKLGMGNGDVSYKVFEALHAYVDRLESAAAQADIVEQAQRAIAEACDALPLGAYPPARKIAEYLDALGLLRTEGGEA